MKGWSLLLARLPQWTGELPIGRLSHDHIRGDSGMVDAGHWDRYRRRPRAAAIRFDSFNAGAEMSKGADSSSYLQSQVELRTWER